MWNFLVLDDHRQSSCMAAAFTLRDKSSGFSHFIGKSVHFYCEKNVLKIIPIFCRLLASTVQREN